MTNKIKPWEQHEVEEEGEPWLISYADMVTLLFGFFVILYSFSTLDDKKFDQMGEKLASAFKAPEELVEKNIDMGVGASAEARQIRALQLLVAMLNMGDSIPQAVEAIEAAATNGTELGATKAMLQEKLKSDPDFTLVQARASDPATIEIVLPARILFAVGQATLSIQAVKKIQNLGRDLRKLENISTIEIVGHTDSTRPGRSSLFKNNFALSAARAGSVAQELMRIGFPSEILSVKGMADLQPMLREGNAKNVVNPKKANDPSINRRVSIILHKVKNK